MLDDTEVADLIVKTRALVLAELDSQPESFDPKDVQLISNDDWQVERFLRRKHYNVADTVKMMLATLKWRRKLCIPSLVDRDFPREFFQLGTVFTCGHDRQNNGVVYMRLRLHRRVNEIEWHLKQYFMYMMEKVDRATQGRGMATVFDCAGAGLVNVDMDIAWFLVSALIHYTPHGVNYALVLDLPWVLTSVWSIIKSWLPTELRHLIKFATRSELTDYIDPENIPHFLGGRCELNYHAVPIECRSLTEMTHQYGISEEVAKRILECYRPYLNEAEVEVKALDSVINARVMNGHGHSNPAGIKSAM